MARALLFPCAMENVDTKAGDQTLAEEVAVLRRRVEALEEMVNTLSQEVRRLFEEPDVDENR